MILRIGLGSLGRNLHADLRNEAFRAYRRSFPVLSGRLRTCPRAGRGRRPMMDDKKRITTEIRDYLARQRISREQFAHQTKLGKSTVDKLLTGLFSERTLVIVESHTGLKLREKPDAASPASAPGAAEALPAPTGLRSRSCRSPISRAIPSRTTSPTASPRTSSRRSRGCAGCSSSPAIRASSTRAAPSTCGRSRASWACATCSKAACAPRASVSGSAAS